MVVLSFQTLVLTKMTPKKCQKKKKVVRSGTKTPF